MCTLRLVQAVVITGAPGAGKTTVLTALMDLLEADGARCAAIEVEALALAHPRLDDDATFDHVAYVASSFRRRGYALLLVGATIEDADYLRRLRQALAVSTVLLVRLDAPPPLLRERLRRREPADWTGLPRLLEAAGSLAESVARLPSVDLVLSTERADPRALAAAVRDALPESQLRSATRTSR